MDSLNRCHCESRSGVAIFVKLLFDASIKRANTLDRMFARTESIVFNYNGSDPCGDNNFAYRCSMVSSHQLGNILCGSYACSSLISAYSSCYCSDGYLDNNYGCHSNCGDDNLDLGNGDYDIVSCNYVYSDGRDDRGHESR